MRFLFAYLPFTLLVIGVLVLGIVGYLIALVRRAKKRGGDAEAEAAPESAAAEEPRPEEETGRTRSAELRSVFASGFQRLKTQTSGRDYRYGIPWFLLIGQRGSRRNDLLSRAGMRLPWGAPDERELASEIGCRWWFFDRGMVLDLAGEYVLRADGETSDRQGWRSFLRLLQKYRPMRPIDGVILTLSCEELLATAGGGAQAKAETEQKATRLYDKLRDAQRTLGLRFPVYLLVTGCEKIPGFESFCAELPDRLKGEMFGWSSPYSVETAYRSDWVDESFDRLIRSLQQVQLEMFAQVSDIGDPDDVFILPGEVAALKEPVRVYTNQLFRPIAYHESMLFRGIYLCGSESPAPALGQPAEESAAPPADAPAEQAARSAPTYFLKDLFEKKIFREAKLGGPTGATLIERNRRVRFAWAGLAVVGMVLALGVSWAHRHLDARRQQLKPFLEDSRAELSRFRATAGRRAEAKRLQLVQAERAQLRQGATRLLRSLSDLDASRFDSVFLPVSWLPGFNGRLRGAFIRAQNDIVFQAMLLELKHRAEMAVSRQSVGEQFELGDDFGVRRFADVALSTPVEDMPEFRALRSYVEGLIELEENGEVYNRLQRTQSLEDLSRVVSYLFGEPLPEGFFRRAGLYRQALRGVVSEKFETGPYRQDAARRTRELVEVLYRRLFEESPFVLSLESLSDELAGLARQRWTVYDEADRLRYVVELTDRVDRALSEPSLYWAFRGSFDLGPEFDRVRAMIDSSAFLRSELTGVSFGDQVYREGQDRWRLLQRTLLDYDGSGLTGPLFKRSRDGLVMQLSDDVEVLQASLEGFLNQSFMTTSSVEGGTTAGVDFSRNRLRWDTNLLKFAVGTHEPYRRFLETGLDYFPAHMQSTLKVVAQRRLNSTLSGLIARSQVLEPVPEGLAATLQAKERELKGEIARFTEAVTPLNQLFTILQEAQLWDTEKDLSELVASQSYQLLQAVDEVLAGEGLYRPRGGSFDWWDVNQPLAFEAFAVKDAEELSSYLAGQRARITALAQDLAQPLVTMLSKTGGETQRDLLLKWDKILAELAGYAEKQPGNSVATLEDLVSKELTVVGLDNCFEVARPAVQAGSTGDFFRDQQTLLRERLYRRCYAVVGERAAAGYEKLARFFSQRLAGKFPFAEAVSDIFPVEADPDTLREFFRIFDAEKGIILGVPASSPAFRGSGAEVRGFVEGMAEVRKFLAAFLDEKAVGTLPVIEFEVEFRVNRQAEIGGDQIIDWILLVGQREIVHPDPNPMVRWTLGDPMQLRLRWAQGSPWAPVRDIGLQEAEISDKTALYRHENRWSLVSFLQRHLSAPTDFVTLKDEKPHTLKFALETRRDFGDETPTGTPIEAKQVGQTRVFVRVSLVTADSKEPILLPEFPRQAPTLGEQVAGR